MKSSTLKLILLSFLLIIFTRSEKLSAQTNSTQKIVNSIKDFLNATSPFFETKYVKADNGKDLKFINYFTNKIDQSKHKGDKFYLTTALSSFSTVMATLSKEDAKKYGLENNNGEDIRTEYQKYLYLSTGNSNTNSDYINIYLNSIRSIPFHLKVKNVHEYEDLDKVINYVSNEIRNNQKNLNAADAYKVNLIHCNFIFSLSLNSYARYLMIDILKKDITDYPFADLENKRIAFISKYGSINDLSKKISSLNNKDYSDLLNDSNEVISGYFTIINEAIRLIIMEIDNG